MTSVLDRTGTALSITGLTKTFPGQVALDGVDLTVRAGEIHALIGQNGCGKSTLVKILAGYHQPDRGVVAEMAGAPYEIGSAPAARAAGVRFVHQQLGLVEDMTVSDNFRLAAEDEGPRLGLLPRKAERARALAALNSLGYDIDPRAEIAELPVAERTAVALARALDGWEESVHLVVLDEVSAALPGPEVDRLFAALRRVAATGVAILFVTHHLDEVIDVADRVTVLRDGRHIITTETRGLTSADLVTHMLGRQLVEAAAAHHRQAVAPAPPLLAARALGGSVLVHLDLDLAPGEVVGVAGLTGSGREELAGLLSGRTGRFGEVRIDGALLRPGQPSAALGSGCACIPSDRVGHALLPETSVRENLTIADLRPFWQGGLLRKRAERKEVEGWVQRLDIRPPRQEVVVGSLSGGNAQKVVMARNLRLSPRVLVLDEPTQGVDVGSKADIHQLVDEAAAGGAAVLVCSSDTDELARLCTRVLVLQRGVCVAELTGSQLTVESIEHCQLLPAAAAAGPTPSEVSA